MHDIRLIRKDPDAFDRALARRGEEGWAEDILALDTRRREAIAEAEAAQAERNRASKEVGAAKARGDEAEFERLRQLMADKKQEQSELEEKARIEQAQMEQVLLTLPNLPLDDVPDGADEADNVEIKRWGEPRRFDFAPKEHFEVAGAAPEVPVGVSADRERAVQPAGEGENDGIGHEEALPSRVSMIAFCTCRRFSASSMATQ